MKKILGLDLGTNSIGWALISENETEKKILGLGSRIIPMSQDILGKFDSGNTVSQTATRTGFRGIRRLKERHLLRRERLHRVLFLTGFLPKHYAESIDFENRLGKFMPGTEPKLAYKPIATNEYEFIFKNSFDEMIRDFTIHQPALFEAGKKIPYDWTIYFLRKKALEKKVEKEQLAWLLLNFNQKRGYYQLRGEEDEENPNKLIEFHSLKVISVSADETQKNKTDIWYDVHLENGWIYRRSSKTPLFDWKDKIKEFIVTTDLNDDGTVKTDKEGNEKRSFRSPSEDDWTLRKKKTESDIVKSKKSVGCYIYDTLLKNPKQKINGKLVRTIERKFYKQELEAILENQKKFHPELKDSNLYNDCLEELYPKNEAHRSTLKNADFTKLFLDDIIFYQRPLKSKKSLISNCPFEFRQYKDKETGELKIDPIKCIAKSHPLFQEFRLWQFIQNIKIYQREIAVDGKLTTDVNVTNEFLKTEDDWVALFDYLNNRKEIDQKAFLKYPAFNLKKKAELYRWNYVEDKPYPANETKALIMHKLKLANINDEFLTNEIELQLWHILYSVKDKHEIEKALNSFASKHNLDKAFVENFKKFPPFKNEYGSFSEKAIKKLLPLMRMGKYWNDNAFHKRTNERIEKIITGEFDENIRNRVREKAINLTNNEDFKGLPVWLASYIVYDRHSEASEILKWKTPQDIKDYLHEFKQHSLRNPIVEQVITETLRVVHDIWKQYGEMHEIHVELGREMKNPAKQREQMSKQIAENENTNLRIKALLAELANHNDIENVRPYSPSQQEILKIYEDGIINSGIEIPEEIAKISKNGQPSRSDLIRYKLWLEQKYRSPYTGEMIPLGKLFTSAYEIEHIIPQSRYFDDSMSNKIICETEVNSEKGNELGYEFIKNNEGKIIETSFNKKVKVFSIAEYEDFVKIHYSKSRSKMKKLLMDDIPMAFIERQLNDSRYISKIVKSLLSNLVREQDEQEATSKNVISCSGGVTSILKQDWGLNDVWNQIITPRFVRMNELTQSKRFGNWTNKEGKHVFQTEVPLELQKGFNKKRIDHRHHAMDALVIACATRSHINYLNNEHARQKDDKMRFDLRNKLRKIEEIEIERIVNGQKVRKTIKVAKEFYKPWETFTQDALNQLQDTVVSFKQNLRIINRTVNYYQRFEHGKKVIVKQTKGDNWAIRKPLHKDTVAGQVNLRFKKQVSLSAAMDKWEMLVDKNLKTKVKQLINEGFDKKKMLKYFAEQDYRWMGKDVTKPELYYFSNEKEVLVASRVALDSSFNSKKILSITDTGIQQILLRHLSKYAEEKDGKTIEHPELAFSSEAIEEMNKNIAELNNGKPHQPIVKVRTYEPQGNKYRVGTIGNKNEKFVEAAKGTNLFFAVYQNIEGRRTYESIPLNIVIERQKQGLKSVPETNDKGEQLLFQLSPNDLVYIPTDEEKMNQISVDQIILSLNNTNKIYKFVSCSENEGHFVPHYYASPILKNEIGSNNKSQNSINGIQIKSICMKIQIDRLGNILKFIR